MISFTPPIKASLFITLTYLICFQFFLHTGQVLWLYPGNICFIACAVLYVRFLVKHNPKFTMTKLTERSSRLIFKSSIFCFFGALVIFLINVNLLQDSKQAAISFGTKAAFLLVFTNALLVNCVGGSVASFITAGLLNEKDHVPGTKHLSSVKG